MAAWPFLLVSYLFCLPFSYINATIIIRPQNAIIVAGQQTMLRCSSDNNVTGGKISWAIGFGSTVISPVCAVAKFPERYDPWMPSSEECDIILKPAAGIAVAGSYSCSDQGSGLAYLSTVVVLETELICTPDRVVVQAEMFNLVCAANFSLGFIPLSNAPVTGWISCDGHGAGQKQSYPVFGWFSLPTLTIPMNATGARLPSFNCTANFDFTQGTDGTTYISAGNSVNHTTSFNESDPFHYCPKNATILPPSGPYFGGEELNCSADSYPPPSYQWIGLGPSAINGSTVKLPADGGLFNVTCSAMGSLSDRNCTAYSQTISLFAVVCPYNVTIIPEDPVVTVNTTLTCAANSTSQSPATYLWTNLLDQTTISGPRITIGKPGSYSWRCSVSVPEGGSNCNSSRAVNGTAVEITTTPTLPVTTVDGVTGVTSQNGNNGGTGGGGNGVGTASTVSSGSGGGGGGGGGGGDGYGTASTVNSGSDVGGGASDSYWTASTVSSEPVDTNGKAVLLVVEIVVPTVVGLGALTAFAWCCSYYAFVALRRRRRWELAQQTPYKRQKESGGRPDGHLSVYSPAYTFRPYYNNNYGRF